MKINTKSWHYRFLRNLDTNIPTSLCPYFWKVVFLLLMCIFGLSMFTAFMWVIGDKLLTAYGVIFDGWFTRAVVPFATGFGFCALAIASVAGIVVGYYWTKENFKPPYKEEPLIISFIKAKKAKFCPHLEFEDMSEKE
ncbi:hypothetical protein OBDJBBDK_00029 [Aeromonas phage AhFM11]|nr:hypothetical protein OBDJBBDK_00029 [Aeromonas phage AhFM11]